MKSRLFLTGVALWLTAVPLNAQSTCRPTVTIYTGLVVNVLPTDTDGDLISDNIGAAVRLKDLIVRADDACKTNKPLAFGMRKGGSGTGMPTDSILVFDCADLGYQPIELWVKDVFGNLNYTDGIILVQDNANLCETFPNVSTGCAADELAPSIFLFNGLTGSLRAVGKQKPLLKVPASALVKVVYDNCSGPLQYRIRKSGTGTGVPGDASVVFNCDELGINLVEVWAGDASGNWAYAETYVLVQDSDNQCNTPTPFPSSCSNDEAPPDLLTFVDLNTELGSNLQVRMYAKDYIRFGQDKCQKFIQWRITKSDDNPNPGKKPPLNAKDYVNFECNDPGSQSVQIWLGDKAGNWTKTEAFAGILGSFGGCKPGDSMPVGYAAAPLPEATHLAVRPNPAREWFVLSGRLETKGFVSVQLYDALGRTVQVLAEQQWAEAGTFRQQFSAAGLPRGVYRCVLRSAGGVQAAVLMLL